MSLIYDIEIKKAILGRNEARIEGIEYCDGWHDHENMGVACIGAYDTKHGRPRMFFADNMAEFWGALARSRTRVTFNGIGFDNKVISACYPEHAHYFAETEDHENYDLLVEVWAGAGLGPKFDFKTHGGYGLDAIAEANGIGRKTGNGAFAPVLYQRGQWGALTDYCLQDVALTKGVLGIVVAEGKLRCPKTGRALTIRKPRESQP